MADCAPASNGHQGRTLFRAPTITRIIYGTYVMAAFRLEICRFPRQTAAKTLQPVCSRWRRCARDKDLCCTLAVVAQLCPECEPTACASLLRARCLRMDRKINPILNYGPPANGDGDRVDHAANLLR